MKPLLFIAGHRGMVGSALVREATRRQKFDILTATRAELDLRDQEAVFRFLAAHRPATVIIAAAKVGGIHANATYPAEFLHDNLAIALNLIEGSHWAGVPRLLFLGSSCIYPRDAQQPITEEALLTGPLETTNEAYALAKIAGLKLCQHYRRQYGRLYHSVMPCNLYGPGDNYHPENSHVIPALIRRIHEAKVSKASSVAIWGTGTPRREFLNVMDLAVACFHVLDMANPPDWVNVGSGGDLPILNLARVIANVIGYKGEILTDPSRPDGTPRKLLDSRLIQTTGWRSLIGLTDGLAAAYRDFLENAQEDAPLLAGAGVAHGVDVETTEEHENRAADGGCCFPDCCDYSFVLEERTVRSEVPLDESWGARFKTD